MSAPPVVIDQIVRAARIPPDAGPVLGRSREGRPVRGFRFGSGPTAVSLLAGCHADEPVGPRLLRHLVGYLGTLEEGHPMLAEHEWWIVPHINPDGERRNGGWAHDEATVYDLGTYLRHVVRELPGDDIEFGFPRAGGDPAASEGDETGAPAETARSSPRPENRAVFDWWRTCDRPFVLHASLHGMGFAAGPWFLLEAAWKDRLGPLEQACIERVEALGYVLHDVERHGEKGFVRLGRGFCTRPDSRFMIRHFEELGDWETAAKFRPSSMEAIRSLGHDTLTMVSEMPLFITPGVGETLGPPDPVAERWKARIEGWRADLRSGTGPGHVTRAAAAEGLVPMPVRDQMDLQWTFIRAGLDLVAG